jgi:hypothetical protein
MIERQFGGRELNLVCDECGEVYGGCPYGGDDFDKMMADARTDGWKNFRREGGWRNACAECSEEFAATGGNQRDLL